MIYNEELDKEQNANDMKAEEPVMAAYVAEAPKQVMNDEHIKDYCRKHLGKDFLMELEENDFYSNSSIPSDSVPQTDAEWTRMADEAEESGWISCEEFFKRSSAWKHA